MVIAVKKNQDKAGAQMQPTTTVSGAGILSRFMQSKNKFVVNIGDEGAIVSYYINNNLQSRVFANITDKVDEEKVKVTFGRDPNALIYLLVDVLEQNYTPHDFPPVNYITLQSLIKNKLGRDYAEDVLKGAYVIEKTKGESAAWRYMFATCPLVSPVSNWVDYVTNLPNIFEGIYFLPLESSSLLKKMNKAYFGTKHSEWQVVVCHNKVSGFRQMAFYKNKLMFSRLISDDNETNPDVIAGNIEQEINNSIEYLRRLTAKTDNDLDLYVICSNDIKESLATVKLHGKNINISTPHDIALKFGYKNITKPEDKFADSILAGNFILNEPVKQFYTQSTMWLSLMEKVSLKLPLINSLFIGIIVLYFGYLQWDMISDYKLADFNADKKKEIEAKLNALSGEDSNQIEGAKVLDIVNLYKLLTGSNINPFSTLAEISKIKTDFVTIKSFDWHLKVKKSDQQNPANSQITDEMLSAKIDMEYFNPNVGYKELWEEYNKFVDDAKNHFKDYDILLTKAEDKISFGQEQKAIQFSMTLDGPKLNKAAPAPSSIPTAIINPVPAPTSAAPNVEGG